ncbi:hypothetical protein LNO78_26780 [Klebsiella pneumoniae subsp. pneumoniae]|nr:hypothetical protein [Klebsiella pneumoniae subsp. pneumoniae]
MHELQWHRIRWPLVSQEEADRRELNTLLNNLERQQLYCNREQLTEIVFSPVRKPGERWTERLQWLLMTDGFGFRSPLSREAGARALAILAGYTGREGDGASGHGDGVERRRNRREALSPLSSASHVHPGVSGTRCKN